MSPDTIGKVRVRAGDVQRDRAYTAGHLLDRYDRFFGKRGFGSVLAMCDEHVPHTQQLSGAESPCIIAPNEKRVLEGRLDAAVDQAKAVVLAEAHFIDACSALGCARQSPRREPFVLRAERHVGSEPRHSERAHNIAGRQQLDRHAPAVGHGDERAAE